MAGSATTTFEGPARSAVRLTGVLADITERKQAELQLQELAASLERKVARRTQALQHSRDVLQSMYDTALIGLALLRAVRNAEGAIEDFVFVSVNRKWQEEAGRFDLVNGRYAEAFPGIVPSGLLDLMRRAVETGESQQTEYFYPHEGSGQWHAFTYVKLDDGLVATTLNITERKLVEQELRKSLRLLEQSELVAGLGV